MHLFADTRFIITPVFKSISGDKDYEKFYHEEHEKLKPNQYDLEIIVNRDVIFHDFLEFCNEMPNITIGSHS